MGPKLFGWTRKGIQYSVRLLPVGGYCRFVGEDDDDPSPDAMNNRPVWRRFLTVLAGPVMNFVLAFAIAIGIYCAIPMMKDVTPCVDTLSEGLPAVESGLQTGDVVTHVNGEEIPYSAEGVAALQQAIQENDAVELTVDRAGEALSFTLTPAASDEEEGRKLIGVTFTAEYARDTFPEAIRDAWGLTKRASTLMIDVLRNLIFKFQGAEDVTGAIGMVAVVSRELQTDFSLILDFMFVISLNLGIINLIPFPGLDGSRLLFLIIEGIRRKPIPAEKEGLVHMVGLVILLGLAAVLAVHDIMTYVL